MRLKILLLSLSVLLAFASVCSAQVAINGKVVNGKAISGSSGSSCTQVATYGASPNDDNSFGYGTGAVWIAASFTTGSSQTTLGELAVNLHSDGSPTGTTTAYLYSASGVSVGSLVATTTNPLNNTTLVSGGALIPFYFSTVTVAPSTMYFWVAKCSVVNSSNHPAINLLDVASGSYIYTAPDSSGSPGAWGADYPGNGQGTIKVYSGSCP